MKSTSGTIPDNATEKKYICGAGNCLRSFKGQTRRYERFEKRGYNVYCSEKCAEEGKKSRRSEASKRFEQKRPSRNRKERLEKIRGSPELYEGYRSYLRNWYSKNKYGVFGETHRLLLNLTKPMWRNK